MLCSSQGISLEAVSSTVAKRRVPVTERLSSLMSVRKAERLMQGTGIHRLSIAEEEICTSDLCYHAAERLFANGFERKDIGALIFITQTADYLTPATSYYLQERLHLPKDIVCYDVNLGCSGFVHGIFQAACMLPFLGDRTVLLLAGDTSSRNAFPEDSGLLSIAGDAGVAAILGRSENSFSKTFFSIESYGERADMLLVKRGGYRAPRLTDETGNLKHVKENFCDMDGMGVMDFSLREVPESIRSLLDFAKIEPKDVDIALVHQANRMIVGSLADKLGIPRERMPFRCEDIGNTSSASIPVLMTEMKRRGESLSYPKILLSGFGVGMSIVSVIMDLSRTNVLGTGEL